MKHEQQLQTAIHIDSFQVDISTTAEGHLALDITSTNAPTEHILFTAPPTLEHVVFRQQQKEHREGEILALPPPAIPEQQPASSHNEKENERLKITGTVKTIHGLAQTPKKKETVFRFTVEDSNNNVERRIAAFGMIATILADPATHLTSGEAISMIAWKHLNTVHIKNEPQEITEWYPSLVKYRGQTIQNKAKK